MKHVMLDLETFGTKPGSVIRSIGAVAFELDGRMESDFYFNIDHQSCRAAGLVVDPVTEKWWSQQSAEAQAALQQNLWPLVYVVETFSAWFKARHAVTVWAQGSNFDPAMWESAAAAVKQTVPWKFYNVRDTRTAYDIGNFNPASVKREGTYHNALDDAKHQVRCVAKAVAQARNGGIAP